IEDRQQGGEDGQRHRNADISKPVTHGKISLSFSYSISFRLFGQLDFVNAEPGTAASSGCGRNSLCDVAREIAGKRPGAAAKGVSGRDEADPSDDVVL